MLEGMSDAARIGRQHEADGWLKFVAWKNRNKKSRKTIECPITPDLAAALAVTPTGDLTYLINDLGSAFTINGSRQQDARLVPLIFGGSNLG